jgi:N-methylhydantoinase B/oxoprolinase/acetone carboxylase alpha subunit
VFPGDAIIIETPGAGGYGEPEPGGSSTKLPA